MLSVAPFLALLLFGACLAHVRVDDYDYFYDNRVIDKYDESSTTESAPVLTVLTEVSPPLILTDLIDRSQDRSQLEAQELAKVRGGPFPEHIPSYSGFFTVNKQFNSNLFFWFFPAETDYENAPILLWLQGGPGVTSLFGLFTEVGPFSVDVDNETLIENPFSWHKNHSIIFIDNPVGTGFSFTDDDQGYATNQTQVGDDLYSAMVQFFKLFPELQKNPFFIAGESYAGKYIPALGYTIHKNNPTADLKINLQGLAVGNGFTDPQTMFGHSEFVFQLGLVDTRVRNKMRATEQIGRDLIENEQYIEAHQEWQDVLDIWRLHSGFPHSYNILGAMEITSPAGWRFPTFVQSPEVRQLLHAGNIEYDKINNTVYEKLIPELMTSVKPWLEVLLDNYRVLYYSGQLDVICAYPLSVNMYQTLNFSATDEYLNAMRNVWYVDGDIAGYTKSGGNFTEVLVRKAGHNVPTDQPAWAFELINRFTSDSMP